MFALALTEAKNAPKTSDRAVILGGLRGHHRLHVGVERRRRAGDGNRQSRDRRSGPPERRHRRAQEHTQK